MNETGLRCLEETIESSFDSQKEDTIGLKYKTKCFYNPNIKNGDE